MMWDFFLYAANVCYYHWLINKATLAYVKTGLNQVGNPEEIQEKRGRV